jgi:hypothetical protein
MSRDQVIDGYLSQIAARLPGRGRTRPDILCELRSGLLDATDDHQGAGLPPTAAARAAVAEFGDPGQVAADVRPELVATQARRLALRLSATAIPLAALWIYAAQASDAGPPRASLWGWLAAPPVPLAAASALIAALTAIVATIAIGPSIRRFHDRPRLAATAAALGATSVAAIDLGIIILLGLQLIAGPDRLSPVPVSAAAIASLARLAIARRGARHCLAARAGPPDPRSLPDGAPKPARCKSP